MGGHGEVAMGMTKTEGWALARPLRAQQGAGGGIQLNGTLETGFEFHRRRPESQMNRSYK
jgi:hypothetical protein